MVSFEEYKILRKRLKKGQTYLRGMWGNTDAKSRELCRMWFSMADKVMEYQSKNEIYPGGKNWPGVEEYIKWGE